MDVYTIATKYQKQTVKDMKSIGTYRKEYDEAIKIYAKIKAEYDILHGRYVGEDLPYFEITENGTKRKAPIVTVLETLRKDILSYSVQLQLTPASNKEEAETEKTGMSRLEEISRELSVVK